MKAASAQLLALLNSNPDALYVADLWTITLIDGTVLRYTSADQDLGDGTHAWSSNGPIVERGTVKVTVGLNVDTLQVKLAPRATDTVNGVAFVAAIAAGMFDGATVQLDTYVRATTAPQSVLNYTFTEFFGRGGAFDLSRSPVTWTVNSELVKLNVKMPRHTYGPSCRWQLYDGGCGLNPATFTNPATVSSFQAPTARAFWVQWGVPQVDHLTDQGWFKFTSGANNGVFGTVVTGGSRTNGAADSLQQITVRKPLPVVPSAGDTLTIRLGCNHTLTDCTNKFGNQARFGGFPYIPMPETAV